jgi:FecR protein
MQNFNTTFKMSLLAAALFSAQGAYAATVGTVTFTTDGATITHADKTVTPAKKSAALMAGDVIDTNAGRLQLSLIDGGKVSLQPNTTYKIERYEFASGKEDGSEYAITELVKGGMRTVSGLIGHKNRDRYQLKTAVATIGIRGTEFTVNFNDNNLLMTTNHGSVDVCNVGGCLNAVTGQTISVAGLGASPKPSKTAAKAAAAAPTAGKAVFAAAETTDVKKLAEAQKPVSKPVNKPDVYDPIVVPTAKRGLSLVSNNPVESGYYDAKFSGNSNGVSKIQNLTDGVTYENNNLGANITFASITNVADIGVIRNAVNSVSGNVSDVYYVVGTAPDVNKISTLRGTYSLVTSASPVMFDLGSFGSENISALGTPAAPAEKVTAIFNFDFSSRTYNYGINLPTTNGSYGISGDEKLGALNTNGTFGSNAIVTHTETGGSQVFLGNTNGYSTGSGIGALQNGNTVIGSFFGTKGQALGLVYGFNTTYNFPPTTGNNGSPNSTPSNGFGTVHGAILVK